jgi:methylase of polypeptide subunit release factors
MVFNPTAFGLTLARWLGPRLSPGTQVCELGLGSGVLSILAGMRRAQVTGLDYNPHAVELTRANWQANGLDGAAGDFRHSNLFEGLGEADEARFDMVWSNPPVLPRLPGQLCPIEDRDGYEVAGADGRLVLDAVLGEAQKYLVPGGRVLTIATSLQGWEQTEARLKEWSTWTLLEEVDLALTDECGPECVAWWLEHTAEGETPRVFKRDGVWRHKVWFLEAIKSS